jgi:hypothetical protein
MYSNYPGICPGSPHHRNPSLARPLLLRLAVKARLKIFAAKNVSKDTKRKIIVTLK